MLYRLLKFPARIALHFYCRKIKINTTEFFNQKGPLLIAANHPNSFLDAIIISSLFKRPIHSLVRGDVYKNKLYSSLLYSLNMLPVYRVTEGVENLENNYDTFNKCKEIFKNDGIVLIFSEGRCINEWKLRPLMKGTARLSISTWDDNIDLHILPLAINYDSFKSFGKIIEINFSQKFGKPATEFEGHGKYIAHFNEELNSRLKPLVFEEGKNINSIKNHFKIKVPLFKKMILFIPAIIGLIIFSPVYYLFKKIITKKWNNDHFDSILVAGGFLIFPVYVLLLTVLAIAIFDSWWMISLLLILPFCAWASLQLKDVLRQLKSSS